MRYSTFRSPKASVIGSFCPALTCGLIVLLAVAPAALAQLPNKPLQPQTGYLLTDGVLIDAAGSTLFVMAPSGLLEAVDIATGNTAWTSDEAAKPLALVHGQLLAQGEPGRSGELALRLFDATSGAAGGELAAGLPAGVWAGLIDGPRHGFRATAFNEGGVVSLEWTATKTSDEPLQGYLPSPEQSLAPGQSLGIEGKAASFDRRQGRLMIDPASGVVRAPAIGSKGAAVPGALLEGRFVAAAEGRQFLSADGRHVLASEMISPLEGFRWSLFTRSGEPLGQIVNRFSAAPFFVAGTTLILRSDPQAWMSEGRLEERPLAIRAVDLASGSELFFKDLGSVEFEGPFPP